MKRWGQKGPENHNRSEAVKMLERCDCQILSAFSALAAAGMPRAPKPQRAKKIEQALTAFDYARARLTEARYYFARCQARLAERVQDHREEPHDKAAVTQLEPLIESSTYQLRDLRLLLVGYAGEDLNRRVNGEERRQADETRTSLFSSDDGVRHRCNWCAEIEQYSYALYALDDGGFAVKRTKAVRFCCYSCFIDGNDLRIPAPKALPPALPLERNPDTETVECVPVVHPQLPAAGEAGHHVE